MGTTTDPDEALNPPRRRALQDERCHSGAAGVAAVVVVEVLWVLVSDAPIGRDATANADGVATSALEIQQNACRDSWSLEQSPEWAFISIASPALRGDAGLVFESE